MVGRILVLRDHAEREIGTTAQIINTPKDDYTRTWSSGMAPSATVSPLRALGLAAAIRLRV